MRDTRDQIDLAIIATLAHTVPELVKECGEHGVGCIVIISAGFMEVREEGQKMTETILGDGLSPDQGTGYQPTGG